MSYYKEAIIKHIVTNVATEGKEAYQKFFNSALAKFGIKSPSELSDEKKKEFFNYIDDNYKAKNESTKEYGKALDKMARDKKLKMLSKKDKALLVKIADLMKTANEGKLSSKIKKAILIAIQMSGNMTGAVKKIEKMAKGLSDDDQVAAALRLANESVGKFVNEDIDRAYDDLHNQMIKVDKALKRHGDKRAYRSFKKWWNELDNFYPALVPEIKEANINDKDVILSAALGEFLETEMDIRKALVKDKRVAKHIGKWNKADLEVYFDDDELVAGGDSGATIVRVKGDMTLGDLKKAILKKNPKLWKESKLNELDWNQDLMKMSNEIDRLFKMAKIKVIKHIPYKRGYRRGDAALYGAFIHVKDLNGEKTVLPIEIDKKGIIRYAGGPNGWHEFEKIGALNMSHARPDDTLKIKTYARSIDYLKQFAKLPGFGQSVLYKKESVTESDFSAKVDAYQSAMNALDHYVDVLKKLGINKKAKIALALLKKLQSSFFQKENMDPKLKEVSSPLVQKLDHAIDDVEALIGAANSDEANDAFVKLKPSKKALIASLKLLNKVN